MEKHRGEPSKSDFEHQSKKLEKAMNSLVEDLDKSHLRKLHADMHSCAAKCCQQRDASLENVYNCVENCRGPVDHAWSYVEDELQGFHEKLSQCLETCTSKSKWITQSSEVQLTRSTKELQECSNKCVDNMIKLLPSILEKMRLGITRYNLRTPQNVTTSKEDEDDLIQS